MMVVVMSECSHCHAAAPFSHSILSSTFHFAHMEPLLPPFTLPNSAANESAVCQCLRCEVVTHAPYATIILQGPLPLTSHWHCLTAQTLPFAHELTKQP